eukprot:comp7325_c0_seq1/m.3022 comp7325_c0_seq1/g.3022  ORF comp7325_c0_seq1/g.3022 comp7325_c0_seq1/m.3022 type:complete len:368 (-) comp7325_c0_seq1:234-1337(-)
MDSAKRKGSDSRQKQQFKKAQKRRKLEALAQQSLLERQQAADDAAKEEAKAKDPEPKKHGRAYTVSVALPGSIIENAQSPELRTYLAGQIGRALAVFQIDEVVIFREGDAMEGKVEGSFDGAKRPSDPNVFLARLLQYLETPQYLRKAFFPMHPDLKLAGLLNPLDSPHHMRAEESSPYREGVTVKRPVKPGQGSLVDCGTHKQVRIDKELQPGLRVTVEMKDQPNTATTKTLRGKVVPPSAPREVAGLYWGYTVRVAGGLEALFSECPYEGGYDLTIGTSERGDLVDNYSMPPFKHLLVVFGGLAGLEASVEQDSTLGADEPRDLFDAYLNTCPAQGSRTIRTEEALLVTMSALRPKIAATGMGPS